MLGTHSITCLAIFSVDNWQTLKLAYWYSPSGLSLKPPLLRFSLMRLIDAKKSSLVMWLRSSLMAIIPASTQVAFNSAPENPSVSQLFY